MICEEPTMKKFCLMLGLCGVLSVGAAFAQPAATPPAAAPVDTTVTSTTTTTTDPVGADNYGTMPKTGGEPILMSLGGIVTAASAFFMRRKLS
jgi:hypothetical protein